MSRKVKIFGLILLYFLACAKSCDNQEQYDANHAKKMAQAASDSLKAEFGTDTLSPETLRTYEATAIMKFNDYRDYLQIVSDKNAAEAFRTKARQMAAGLFISGDADALQRKPFKADSVLVALPFSRAGDSLYEGALGFRILEDQPTTGLAAVTASKGTMKIFLAKRTKVFGTDTLKVWGVYLGAIK